MSRFRGSFGGSLARNLRQLHETGSSVGLGDSELLKRYAFERDESAFESLVERHGPMVRRVCRRLLNDPSDVEDAVQATFLVLVRKAGRVRRPDLLGNWLYGVACRVSAQARSNAIRRRDGLESIVSTSDPVMACRASTQRGGDPVIDEQWVLWCIRSAEPSLAGVIA
jgi:DNA-directed RNA polymerase specialized sigma24 family protein